MKEWHQFTLEKVAQKQGAEQPHGSRTGGAPSLAIRTLFMADGRKFCEHTWQGKSPKMLPR